MNYWPAEVANLSECAIPFFDYVDSLRGVRTEATRAHYPGVRGWTVQTENNIFGAGSFKWNPPGSAWYAQQFWEHYAFTRDQEFLRKTAYPVLKEVAEFWEDHLMARAGRRTGHARRLVAGAWPRRTRRDLRPGTGLRPLHQLHRGRRRRSTSIPDFAQPSAACATNC